MVLKKQDQTSKTYNKTNQYRFLLIRDWVISSRKLIKCSLQSSSWWVVCL